METGLENTIMQWEEGSRRLNEAGGDPDSRRRLQRAVDRIHSELRRKLGANFRVAELVDLYTQGTDWCLEIALSVSSGGEVVDSAVATDAAFYLYMREASDFAGGRVIAAER